MGQTQDIQRRGGLKDAWWLVQIVVISLMVHGSNGASPNSARITAGAVPIRQNSCSLPDSTAGYKVAAINGNFCRGGNINNSLDSNSDVTNADVEISETEEATEMSTDSLSAETITTTKTTTTRVTIEKQDDGSSGVMKTDESSIDEKKAISNDTETNRTITNETAVSVETNATSIPKPRVFGVYQEGDGHIEDLDGIPTRYLVMAKGNRDHALKAFVATKEWRQNEDVDHILAKPHPKFDQVKYVFPHFFPGRDAQNNPVLVQRPGLLKKEAMHSLNVTHDDLMHHMIYTLEYCWNLIEPKGQGLLVKEKEGPGTTNEGTGDGNPQEGLKDGKISNLKNYGVMTSIIDLDGLGFRTLRDSETLGFVKRVVSVMSHHYPSRSYKTLLINTPRWFETIYALLKPLLRESTKRKIDILSTGKQQDEALRDYLGPNGVPEELLSTNKHKKESKTTALFIDVSDDTRPGPSSQLEREMRAFCMEVLEEHGVSMLPIALSETER